MTAYLKQELPLLIAVDVDFNLNVVVGDATIKRDIESSKIKQDWPNTHFFKKSLTRRTKHDFGYSNQDSGLKTKFD